MKCIKNLQTGELKRVDDEMADKLCKGAKVWWYAPKSEWKAATRKPVITESNNEEKKTKKKEKAAKRTKK
jgi:hypothetical protein